MTSIQEMEKLQKEAQALAKKLTIFYGDEEADWPPEVAQALAEAEDFAHCTCNYLKGAVAWSYMIKMGFKIKEASHEADRSA